MGYSYTVKGYFRVKEHGKYPWPCQDLPKRMLELWPDDVLTKAENGSYTKHTGLMMTNIRLQDDQVEPVDGGVELTVGSMFG